jgi:hypothetical protein
MDQQSYAMHKLVHAWGYDRREVDKQRMLSLATLGLVVEAIEECGKTPQDKLRLVPHVMANISTLVDASHGLDHHTKDTIDRLEWIGEFISGLWRWPELCVVRKLVLNKMFMLLGEEHPDTITAMNNLANTLRDQGQLEEAAKMLRAVLEKRRRILGEEYPDTISAMNNLAITLGDQG